MKCTDGIRDAPLLYAEGTINVKVCFSLIIEVYALTLSWPDLQHPKNNELLRGKKIMKMNQFAHECKCTVDQIFYWYLF